MTESESPAPDHAGVFLPPPLIYIVGIAAGYFLQRVWPLPLPPAGPARVLGWACGAGWALFALPGVLALVRARTSILPIRASRVLVENGPYRFTRNPMYLGLALLQAGIGLLWGQPWVLVMVAPVVALIDLLVIVPEERYLDRRFGDEYRAYRKRVRRWI
jgi:protein-S-isoprenylcysteine O-methyltransferase Ste14